MLPSIDGQHIKTSQQWDTNHLTGIMHRWFHTWGHRDHQNTHSWVLTWNLSLSPSAASDCCHFCAQGAPWIYWLGKPVTWLRKTSPKSITETGALLIKMDVEQSHSKAKHNVPVGSWVALKHMIWSLLFLDHHTVCAHDKQLNVAGQEVYSRLKCWSVRSC